MIYIIGDSHVSVFSGTDKTHDGLRHIQPEFGTCYTISQGQLRPLINRFEQRIPYFCPIKIGSNTAYNSYNKLPRIEQVIKEYNITKDDWIFTCFGEIDIRNHIGFNTTTLGLTLSEAIRVCVDKYMVTVRHIKELGLRVGVYGAPASSVGTPNSPIEYGDVVIRNNMTTKFNNYLRSRCEVSEIPFVEIASKMILSDGTTDTKFIMDDIHLSQEAMPLLKEAFEEFIC